LPPLPTAIVDQTSHKKNFDQTSHKKNFERVASQPFQNFSWFGFERKAL